MGACLFCYLVLFVDLMVDKAIDCDGFTDDVTERDIWLAPLRETLSVSLP